MAGGIHFIRCSSICLSVCHHIWNTLKGKSLSAAKTQKKKDELIRFWWTEVRF